ncbi:EamA family transporter [Brevibacterium sp.]|uniref:EamA family transporter n=1 Tax=Brevibacterium sp. TaxID=1701 RepID=UPI0028112267|nr:EamA family transporter [Brevibacterium sp.]
MTPKPDVILGRGVADVLPPWSLAVTAMLLIQLCNASSVVLFDEVGTAGTAWLRLCMGAVIFVVIARPPLRRIRREDIAPLLGLGVASGLMTTAFLAAIDRIPLGTAVAIEFLGPLVVAAIRSKNRQMLAWPALALVGVVLLTEPWGATFDPLGIAFAAAAGLGWGTYILLTQRIGDRFTGITGLAITIPIAAVVTTIVGAPQAIGGIDLRVILIALGLALLAPVLPFGLEMLSLRRMTPTAFGTLMALEPAFGVIIGLVFLSQVPALWQVVGIVLVVLAGSGAQRGGRRPTVVQSSEAVD